MTDYKQELTDFVKKVVSLAILDGVDFARIETPNKAVQYSTDNAPTVIFYADLDEPERLVEVLGDGSSVWLKMKTGDANNLEELLFCHSETHHKMEEQENERI